MDINLPSLPPLTPELLKDPTLCQVFGCTNKRSNAGYGRLRKVCEKHHHQRVHVGNAGATKTRSWRQQFHEDLTELETIARERGLLAVLERIGELQGKY